MNDALLDGSHDLIDIIGCTYPAELGVKSIVNFNKAFYIRV